MISDELLLQTLKALDEKVTAVQTDVSEMKGALRERRAWTMLLATLAGGISGAVPWPWRHP